jgi:predicted Zn finger-like uncharacterized protein
MSLATRCTHCNTAFKVVQDQLKVSQGWVRCGHCHQVFNALEEMFDTEQQSVWSPSMLSGDFDEAEPLSAPEPSHSAQQPPANTNNNVSASVTSPTQAASIQDDSFDLEFPSAQAEPAMPQAPQTPAPSVEPAVTSDTPVPEPVSESPPWSKLMATATDDALERSLPPPSQRRGRPGTRGRTPPPAPAPGFVKQAERQAIWRHPAVRIMLGLLALLLLALLGLQAAHHWRNQLAAQLPASQPWLQAWCDVAGCKLTAPSDLESLTVDGITVVKADSQGNDTYQLTVVIRNRSGIALSWPMLDLTLTDSNGAVLTRKSLSAQHARLVPVGDDHNRPPTSSQPTPPTVAPGSTALQWQLRAPELQLSSYTAELFYP